MYAAKIVQISVDSLSPSHLGATSVCVPVPFTCHHGIMLQQWMRFPKECNWQLKVSQRSTSFGPTPHKLECEKNGNEKTIHARLGSVNKSPASVSGSDRSVLTKRPYVLAWAEAMVSLQWMLQHGQSLFLAKVQICSRCMFKRPHYSLCDTLRLYLCSWGCFTGAKREGLTNDTQRTLHLGALDHAAWQPQVGILQN
jgi:hypothetical protein